MVDRYCDGCDHPHELCRCHNPDYDPALADGFPQVGRGDGTEEPPTIAEAWVDQLQADDEERNLAQYERLSASEREAHNRRGKDLEWAIRRGSVDPRALDESYWGNLNNWWPD